MNKRTYKRLKLKNLKAILLGLGFPYSDCVDIMQGFGKHVYVDIEFEGSHHSMSIYRVHPKSGQGEMEPDCVLGAEMGWLIGTRNNLPVNAEFLFYIFLNPNDCEAVVGDLEERYRLIHMKFGQRRANFWYWSQAIRSIGPIVWAWSKKAALKPVLGLTAWAVGKGLFGHDSWLAALVELYRKIRS